MTMKTDLIQASDAAIRSAAALLRKGELVAFPTETVYGLGANAWDEAAVRKIFVAKDRPADNPLIVHIAQMEQMETLARKVSADARRLAKAFWPGPLTMVLPARDEVPRVVTAGLSSVGIRLPEHPVARALLREAGLPVAAPSANRSGRPSPTTAQHVWTDLQGRLSMILDGGPCRVGVESTVVDMTGEVPVILRPGGITPEQIQSVTGSVRVHESALSPLASEAEAASPGMKYRHYAPTGQVLLIAGADISTRLATHYDAADALGERAVILAPMERKAELGARAFLPMGRADDPESMARSLFAALREAEASGADRIFVEAIAAEGMGLAVMNRLCRAAGFQIEEE